MRTLCLVLLLAAAPARALMLPQPEKTSQTLEGAAGGEPNHPVIVPSPAPDNADSPLWLRWMLSPTKNGMSVRLPMIDTDPNRGTTIGFMPIWIVRGEGSDTIRHIHAPSITRNKILKWTETYRYYYYPKPDATLSLRGEASTVVNHEAFALYEDETFLGSAFSVGLKFHYNVDGTRRFYGVGPATPKNAETNYTDDTIRFAASVGLPIFQGMRWLASVSYVTEGQNISNGPINSLPDLDTLLLGGGGIHRHQNAGLRATFSHDTRNGAITPTQGHLASVFAETSQKTVLGSEYVYNRYGAEARRLDRMPVEDKLITASRLRFEQLIGNGVPFWQLPQLGGKYVHRGYGEGRYIDKGLLVGGVEERWTALSQKMGGVKVEFELAPYAELGTVFDTPGHMQRRYARPVLGAAVRAVAPPQVVGSIDVGAGQEGVNVFMDINYSF